MEKSNEINALGQEVCKIFSRQFCHVIVVCVVVLYLSIFELSIRGGGLVLFTLVLYLFVGRLI